ncbi:MAG: hypothetical protein ABIF82_04865 [Planctomycetota bacterium]
MRVIIAAGKPSARAIREVETIKQELELLPRTAVVPGLLVALRDGEDEFNSVLIGLLDEFNATDWVPVKFRARTMTVESAVELIHIRASGAEQADAYVGRIREFCSADPAALASAWLGLLESPPIYAWGRGTKVEVTSRVQGIALLGLIRTMQPGDLGMIVRRIQQKRVTARPVLLSQCLIHLSGGELKSNLAQWLSGPETAQAAAVIAVDLLHFRRAKVGGAAAASDIKAAASWVRGLSDAATSQSTTAAQLRALVLESGEKEPDREQAVRLATVRRYLNIPPDTNPITWLTTQPVPDRRRALERLVGIDLLIGSP